MTTMQGIRRNIFSTIAAAAAVLSVGSSAAAAVPAQSALTQADTVHVGGMPYGNNADGAYVFTGEVYQGAPVYRHSSSGWALYRRANGVWHVDFNDVSEAWSGTIAYALAPAQSPWTSDWQGEDQVVTRTGAVYIAADNFLEGSYHFRGQTTHGKPVYQHETVADRYLHSILDGNDWGIGPTTDTNGVWTYAIGCDEPWSCNFQYGGSGNTATVHHTTTVTVDSTAFLGGGYTFTGQLDQGLPVYQIDSGADIFLHSILDGNDWGIGPDLNTNGVWSYAIGCADPWTCNMQYGSLGGQSLILRGQIVSSTTLAIQTAHGQYVVAEGAGGGDVNANRSAIGAWETLRLITLDTGLALLQAPDGEFLCPDNGGGSDVHATNLQAIDSCHFTLFEIDNGNVAFMADSGHYLSAPADGQLLADATTIGANEQFVLQSQGAQ